MTTYTKYRMLKSPHDWPMEWVNALAREGWHVVSQSQAVNAGNESMYAIMVAKEVAE